MKKKQKAKKDLTILELHTKINNLIFAIGTRQRSIVSINTSLNEEIETLKKKAAERVKKRQKAINELAAEIYKLAQTHKKQLIPDEKIKSVRLSAGEIAWQITPWAVKKILTKEKDGIISFCKENNLEEFIRIIEEPNKKIMLQDKDKAIEIPGIEIQRREELIIKPTEGKAITKKIKPIEYVPEIAA